MADITNNNENGSNIREREEFSTYVVSVSPLTQRRYLG